MRCGQGKFTTPTPLMSPVNGVCFVVSKHLLSLYAALNSSRNLKQENLLDVFVPTINKLRSLEVVNTFATAYHISEC
jgi:hypothetical protein